MFGMGMQELIILGVIAVLLFGKKLPDVAKSLGSSYREFRKGLTDLQSHVDFRDTMSSPYTPPSKASYDDHDDYDDVSSPKFVPPPAEAEEKATSDEGIATSE